MSQEMNTQRPSLLVKMGAKYSLEPNKLYETLCKTAFAAAQNHEQVVALLIVADAYGLNPFTKEIYAFPDKSGGVVPVVGVDGWNRIAQQHPQFDGVELRYAEKITQPDGGRPCPEWAEAVVYRKDREHPVIVREYLDECYRPTAPWKSHTKRMLRHKALIQGYRVAFGFHGIYDPEEAESIAPTETPAMPEHRPAVADRVAARLGVNETTGEVIEAEVIEAAEYEPVEGEVPPDASAPPEAAKAPENGPQEHLAASEDEPPVPGMDAAQAKAKHQAEAEAGTGISPQQLRQLGIAWRKLEEAGWPERALREHVALLTGGKTSRKQLTVAEASAVVKSLNAELQKLGGQG